MSALDSSRDTIPAIPCSVEANIDGIISTFDFEFSCPFTNKTISIGENASIRYYCNKCTIPTGITLRVKLLECSNCSKCGVRIGPRKRNDKSYREIRLDFDIVGQNFTTDTSQKLASDLNDIIGNKRVIKIGWLYTELTKLGYTYHDAGRIIDAMDNPDSKLLFLDGKIRMT